MTPPGAIVLGDDYRALGIARSLGRRGIPVTLVADRLSGPAQFSRYTSSRRPWLGDGDDARIETVARLGADAGAGSVVFPTDDGTAELLARAHEELSRIVRLTVSPWSRLRHALDKRLAAAAAVAAGVDVPNSWTVDDSRVIEAELRFPVVLKPAVKHGQNELVAKKAWRIDSRGELDRAIVAAAGLVGRECVVVQEFLRGGGEAQFSYAALCEAGAPLARLVARRTRQYPIDFGKSSSYVEVVEQAAVADAAERLLRHLRYSGLVEVEFKFDASTGRYLLLDVNPRLWTWHALGTFAGVDFPYLAWLHARGEGVPPTRARVGASWTRLATDLPAAALEIRRRRLGALSFVRSHLRRTVGAVYAADDPVPALVDLPLLGIRAVQSRRGRPSESARAQESRLLRLHPPGAPVERR